MTFCEECGQQMPNYCDDCGLCFECCRCWDEVTGLDDDPTDAQLRAAGMLDYTPPEPFTIFDKDNP